MMVKIYVHYCGVIFIRRMKEDPRLPSSIMFAEADNYKVNFETVRSCTLDSKHGVIVEYDLATDDGYSQKALEALGAWSHRAIISEEAAHRGFDVIIKNSKGPRHEKN